MTRILVIEPDPAAAAPIVRGLESRDWLVDVADNGLTAVELTTTGRYDLAVLDLADLNLNGFMVLRQILAGRPEQKVVALISPRDPQIGVLALERGATDYMVSSATIEELLARVNARLLEDATIPPSGSSLSRGDMYLDLARRKVIIGQKEISLTARELMVLAYLMRNPDRVVTREELLLEVWGISSDPGSNAVDACIRRLRSKVGWDAVETIRNVGYAFGAA